ncbi:uncharacterized protein LOC108675467 [Hyalella azteca]|uniref:Uncharacterized protein LOC108675467 n=1 Tax=Hyalella azteca TaxID=294128 RepID=A0A979FH40_HYAAZ|nr:uncharacterized protein LOC108675467 [Hyalella azteca]
MMATTSNTVLEKKGADTKSSEVVISPLNSNQPSRENSGTGAAILAGLEELLDNAGASHITEIFMLTYRGSSEVDRHYTKAMLPWIIAEIKNQKKYEKVKVEISQGMVTVLSVSPESEMPLFAHSVKQIHQCVMEQADHTHFLYTLKPMPDKENRKQEHGNEALQVTPVFTNASAGTDHQCHLFKAESEEYVRSFFKCLRQQPKDSHQVFRTRSQLSVQALPETFLHGETQFYEVLFVGRVKVSHCKVPASFIDEACEAFKHKKNSDSRNSLNSDSVASGLDDYQKVGSGYSVPNINFSTDQPAVRSNFRDQKGESRKKHLIQQQSCGDAPPSQHRVRFTLDTDIDQYLDQVNEPNDDTTKGNKSISLPSGPVFSSNTSSPLGSRLPSSSSSLGSTKEFTPIQEIIADGESVVVEEEESGQLVRSFSIRVPEKVNWYLPSEEEKTTVSSEQIQSVLKTNIGEKVSEQEGDGIHANQSAIGGRDGDHELKITEAPQKPISPLALPSKQPFFVFPTPAAATPAAATPAAATPATPAAATPAAEVPTASSAVASLRPLQSSVSSADLPSSPPPGTDDDLDRPSFKQLIKRRYSEQLAGPDSEEVSAKNLFTAYGRSSAAAIADDDTDEGEPPYRPRLRTISGNSSAKLKRSQFTEIRERTGSMGSASTRPRPSRPMSDADPRVSGGNRSLLFHVGREELQLINPELKTIQLRKSFKDIPQRCQGILNNDHFGFICREVAADQPVYVGYIFRCDNPDVTKEIVLSLNRAFEAVASAHQKEKQAATLCESCPMRWLSALCTELEGLPATRAHALILRRVQQLPEGDRDLLLAKYEGAEAPEVQHKNNVLMMLLRAHMESQQQTHVHIWPASTGPKGVEASLHRVRKSLATSFHSMLKRDPASADRDLPPRPPAEQVRVENVSDSPLGKTSSSLTMSSHRPRSLTVSAVGGDTMRREFLARQQKPVPHTRGVLTPNQLSVSDIPTPGNIPFPVGKSPVGNSSVGKSSVGNSSVGKSSVGNSPVGKSTLGEEKSLSGKSTVAAEGKQVSSGLKISPNATPAPTGNMKPPQVPSPRISVSPESSKDYQLRSLSPEMEALESLHGAKKEPIKMSRRVAKEVYGGSAPHQEDEEKENIPENRMTRPKMNIFLKVGSPTGGRVTPDEAASGDDDDDDGGDDGGGGDGALKPPSSPSFRHAILQRVITPLKPDEEVADDDDDEDVAATKGAPVRRTWQELRVVWMRAVFRQMLLTRLEQEIRTRRELEEELELQRVCLSYDEEPLEEEAVHTWRLVLSRPHARLDQSILRAGVRQGVPKALRGDIWHLMMLQPRPSLRLPVVPHCFHKPYQHMIQGLTSQQHAILIDLGRTFPQHPYFTRTLGPGQLGLFNLLKAYSLLDEDVGYCQGLSFVAGILLMHVNEETAYELLKHLMYVAGVRRQFRQDLDGLQVQMYQLSRLVHDKLVRVYNHFESNEISPQLYAAPWFLTLFASTFPLHFVVRLYDLLFLEGLEAVFRVSLVLLRQHEEMLLACDGFEDIMRYLKQELPRVPLESLPLIFDQAFELNLSEELSAYEVEYQVLREELSVTPQRQHHSVTKLKQERRALKRQNLDLAEQLQQAQAQKRALESSNQLLQQSQHHLEVRVRFLEVERGNLKQLVEQLWRSGVATNPDFGSAVAPGLQRYLPCHSNSPQPLGRKELAKIESESCKPRPASASACDQTTRSPETSVHVNAATLLGSNVASKPGDRLASSAAKPSETRQSSSSHHKSLSPDAGPLRSHTSLSPTKAKGETDSIFPPFNIHSYFTRDSNTSTTRDSNTSTTRDSNTSTSTEDTGRTAPHRPRSSTMDHGSMQRFVRGLTRNN